MRRYAKKVRAVFPLRVLPVDQSDICLIDERKARIVELKFFGGLSVEETAEVIGVSAVTVMREWQKAKAWLYVQLDGS